VHQQGQFLDRIRAAYEADQGTPNLLFVDYFADAVTEAQGRVASADAAEQDVGVPAFSSALAWYDGYRASAARPNSCRACATTSAPTRTGGSTVTGPPAALGQDGREVCTDT
jgi:6-phosphogluconate dehydrogenase